MSASESQYDTSNDSSPTEYTGPDFFFDTGATSSFGQITTPLDSSKPCFRQVRGINSTCIARIEGPCKAIPNVALSKDFDKNLASVSQLAKNYKESFIFDQHHVYAGPSFPPGTQPKGTSLVGSATCQGLYKMDMNAYQRHVRRYSRSGHTVLGAGEAASKPSKQSSSNTNNLHSSTQNSAAVKGDLSTTEHSSHMTPPRQLPHDCMQLSQDCREPNPTGDNIPERFKGKCVISTSRSIQPHELNNTPDSGAYQRRHAESKHHGLHSSAPNSAEVKGQSNDQALPVADYHPSENAMRLHTRMGHASKKVMIDALKQGITLGVPITLNELIHSNIYCKACAASKQNRKPYPRKSATEPSDTILGLVHTDTAGPRTRSTIFINQLGHRTGHFKYWQVYVDDHSKYIWVDFLSSKGQLPSQLKKMSKTMAMDARDSKQAPPAGALPLRVRAFRSDNAGELSSKEVVAQLHKAMIDHERTIPNSSSQNAHAESAIKIIQDMARTYLDSARFPLKYWPFAIECAAYTMNRLPCTSHPEMKSRFELFYGHKPDYKHLKTFGSVVTKWQPLSKRKHGDKLSPTGEGGFRHRLIGYPRKRKGYLVLDTERQPNPRVFPCRNIHLQENVEEFPDLDSSDSYTSDSSSDSDSEFTSDSSLNLSDFDSTDSHFHSDSSEASSPPPDSDNPAENSASDLNGSSTDAHDSSAEERSTISSDLESIHQSPPHSDSDNQCHRQLVTSKSRDTVNKIAKRYGVNAQLLCNMNDGIAGDRPLRPTDHLRKGTELYLPTPSDEERFEDLPSSSSSSDTETSSGSPVAPTQVARQPPEPTNQPEQPQAAAAPAPVCAPGAEAQAQANSAHADRSKSAPPTSIQLGSFLESKSSDSPHASPPVLQSLADPTATSQLPESCFTYTSVDKEKDISDEAYDLAMAALYAGAPACDASLSTRHKLTQLCDYVCPRIRLAIQQTIQGNSYDHSDLYAAFMNGFHLFESAYMLEEAHLIQALKHIPAREIPTPKNHAEAMRSQYQEYWNDAVATELANLKAYDVYKLEKLPPGAKPINSRFVFKVKANQQGLVDRLKARLVVQGFRQRYGIDYLKTHASVCKLTTFRYQMALAAQLDMIHDIIDVKSAYLEADMDMPVYINIPGVKTPPGMGHRLVKSLYGTKQAGHNWHETIVPKLTNEWGFKQSIADPCMFYHNTSKKDYCILCLFVDDFSITSTRGHTKSRDLFLKRLNQIYKTSRSDDSNVYLGIRCRRLGPHKIFLDQELYVIQFLHAYGFSQVRPASTPTSGAPLSKNQCPVEASEKEAMARHPYRQIIGSLRYLEHCTRPDIAFALNRLSRYQANPGLPHWNELKHLVRYVAGTSHHGICFGADCYPQHALMDHDLSGPLECFVDSDHAADKDTRRSCTGYVFFSRGGPISWRSRLQNSTALSTTEAEFMAASDAGCENAWLRRLIGETTNLTCTRLNGVLVPQDIAAPKLSQKFYDYEVPTKFYEDNLGCIKCSENPVLHGRMKHIDIKYHRIKEFVKNGDCILIYVNTSHQIADLLTKALPKSTFTPLRDCLVIDPFKQLSLSS